MRQRPSVSPTQAERASHPGRVTTASDVAAPRPGPDAWHGPSANRDEWRRLRVVAYLTVGVTYLLIIAGAVVRVSGSGLGCPDWPLCHGQVVPPVHPAGIIEYSHRVLGGIGGLLILTTVVLWARAHHFTPRVVLAGTGLLLLLAVQVGLGAAVVGLELPPMLVAVHLGMAMLLFGLLITIAVSTGANPGPPRIGGVDLETTASQRFARLVIAATVGVYLVALAGAYVRATGSSGACYGFPTCNGSWLPFGSARSVDIHLLHRLLAYAVSAHLLVTIVRAWRFERQVPHVAVATTVVAIALLAQIAFGAAVVSLGVPPLAQLLHVAGATALWGTTVWLLALTLRSRGRLGGTARISGAEEDEDGLTRGRQFRLIDAASRDRGGA